MRVTTYRSRQQSSSIFHAQAIESIMENRRGPRFAKIRVEIRDVWILRKNCKKKRRDVQILSEYNIVGMCERARVCKTLLLMLQYLIGYALTWKRNVNSFNMLSCFPYKAIMSCIRNVWKTIVITHNRDQVASFPSRILRDEISLILVSTNVDLRFQSRFNLLFIFF